MNKIVSIVKMKNNSIVPVKRNLKRIDIKMKNKFKLKKFLMTIRSLKSSVKAFKNKLRKTKCTILKATNLMNLIQVQFLMY